MAAARFLATLGKGSPLPVCGLLLALSTVWLFAGKGYFYGHREHDQFTAKNMAIVANLAEPGGSLFTSKRLRPRGSVRYDTYNRFPIGSYLLIGLVTAPFDGDFSTQLASARALMLAFFCAAAILAYLALAQLTGSRAVALGATLVAFSSYHALHYSDVVSSEAPVDLFAVMLVFHGMVLASQGKHRFGQLAIKTCVALLLGWHVYGLLLPFLVLGGASSAASAWRASASKPFAGRLGAAALAVPRSRTALLGALALLFGVGVLGTNVAREYAAFDGRRAIENLPSVRSMFQRSSADSVRHRLSPTPTDSNSRGPPSDDRGRLPLIQTKTQPLAPLAGFLVHLGITATIGSTNAAPWTAEFLKKHLHRIGALHIPFALRGDIELDEMRWRDSVPWFWLTGIPATLGALTGLVLFRGPRSPPAALALAGIGWAVLAPGQTGIAAHQFEALFHIGVPLCLFATVLMGVRRLFGRPVAVVGAGAAMTIFAMSSVAMTERNLNDGEAHVQRQAMAEFDAIAETIRGRTVWVAAYEAPHRDLGGNDCDSRQISDIERKPFTIPLKGPEFFTTGSFLYCRRSLATTIEENGEPDFALTFERYRIPTLLTPAHEYVFLYRAGVHSDALIEAMADALVQEAHRLGYSRPAVRGTFSTFTVSLLPGNKLHYFRSSCRREDTQRRIFLHVVPQVPSALSKAPRQHGFDNFDFDFNRYGYRMADGSCMAMVPLLDYRIARIRTGQRNRDGSVTWSVEFTPDPATADS